MLAREMRERRDAAIKMQAMLRKSIAAKFRTLILKRRHAANRVASTWRMFLAKRKLTQLKSEDSASRILTRVRKFLRMHRSEIHNFFAAQFTITQNDWSNICAHNYVAVHSNACLCAQVSLLADDSAELSPHETSSEN